MGGILLLYQSQGLFVICVHNTAMTENSDSSWTAGHNKKKSKKENHPVFNFVKIHSSIYFIIFFLTEYLN